MYASRFFVSSFTMGGCSSFLQKKPTGKFLTVQDSAGIIMRPPAHSSLAILPGFATEQRIVRTRSDNCGLIISPPGHWQFNRWELSCQIG
jgi:hypothetical protein